MLRLGAVILAITVPALFAISLVRAAGAPGDRLDAGLLERPLLLAQASPGTAAPGGGVAPARGLVTGVLYTRGRAEISWNGATFSVTDGSYAYVGGEAVKMSPGAIGLLKLPGGGSVYMCGSSTVTVSPSPGGGYAVVVKGGSSRVQLPAGVPFRVSASDTLVRPAPGNVGSQPVETEVQVRSDGGCLVCELGSALAVSAGGEKLGPGAVVGRVIEVAAGGSADGSRFSEQAIPPGLLHAGGQAGAGPAYLCRCEDLKRELESRPEEDTRLAETGTEQTETATAETETAQLDPAQQSQPSADAQPGEQPVSEPAVAPVASNDPPPVAPPDAPPLALAEAAAPDPFDPNVLPPPAAGETGEPVVIVAPPGVPGFGSGGGGGGDTGGGGGGGGPTASPS